jgi:hypothetical protein
MKNKALGTETMLGGIFGIIAITAALLEMQTDAFSTASIFGGIKDIAGTMVAVMVFLIAIRSLLPKKEKLTFEEKLKAALSDWEKSNSSLVVKSNDDDKTHKYGFSMRTDINDFYRASAITKNVGWFVRLPPIAKENYQTQRFDIVFHLNKGTFFEGISKSDAELKQAYSKLGDMFSGFINTKYGNFAKASSKHDEIIINIKPITNDGDIKTLVNLLNSMFQAYLAAANIKVE